MRRLVGSLTASPALAQRGPVSVVPGRIVIPGAAADVPVHEWGRRVVGGDRGRFRPGAAGLDDATVIYRLPPSRCALCPGRTTGPVFSPRLTRSPAMAGLEDRTPARRPLPQPAQTYRKSWSSQSAAGSGHRLSTLLPCRRLSSLSAAERHNYHQPRSRPRSPYHDRRSRSSQIATACSLRLTVVTGL